MVRSFNHVISFSFLVLILIGGCCTSPDKSFIDRAYDTLSAPKGKTRVVFYRSAYKERRFTITLYDGPNILGNIDMYDKISYLCEPGEHVFKIIGVRKDAVDFIEADLVSEHTYFVEIYPSYNVAKVGTASGFGITSNLNFTGTTSNIYTTGHSIHFIPQASVKDEWDRILQDISKCKESTKDGDFLEYVDRHRQKLAILNQNVTKMHKMSPPEARKCIIGEYEIKVSEGMIQDTEFGKSTEPMVTE